MDRRARHDLRQPIATMSMIASTLAQLGGTVDQKTKSAYREQVEVELERLDGLVGSFGAPIDLEPLKLAAARFVEDVDDLERSNDLQAQCELLLKTLSKKGDE
jgi:signal transduction histidine kinase